MKKRRAANEECIYDILYTSPCTSTLLRIPYAYAILHKVGFND